MKAFNPTADASNAELIAEARLYDEQWIRVMADRLDAAEKALAKSQECAIEYSRLFDNEAMSRHLVEQELAESQVAAEKATAISIRNIDARKEVQAQLIKTEAALVGEKARVDIAERRSIAAGAQVEELQAQIIDLNIYHRKATKELVERLQRSYEDGVIIGRHNDDLTAALRKADARIASADAILIKVAAQGESYLSLGTLLAIRAYVQHINDWADDAASK